MKRFFILFLSVPFFSYAESDYTQQLRFIHDKLGLIEDDTSNISTKLLYIYDFLDSIQGDSTVIRSDVRTIKSTLSDISDDVSSLSDISDYVETIKNDLSSVKGYQYSINDYLSSISTVIDSDVVSDLGYIHEYLSLINYKLGDLNDVATESTLSSIASDISSILSNFPSVDDLAKESTLSSIYDSLGDNVGTDLGSIDNSLSSLKSFFTSSYASSFFRDFNNFVDPDSTTSVFSRYFFGRVPRTYIGSFYTLNNGWLSDPTILTLLNEDNSDATLFDALGLYFRQVMRGMQASNSVLAGNRALTKMIYNMLNSNSTPAFLTSVVNSLGNVATSADIQAAVELLGTISGDVSSILAKMDESSSDDDDEEEDPWSEFRQKYLTLFDNQPIPTYEIDYALIGWETNSVATKATLTQTSGNFFDLCLAFAMDANKIAASESIFLHKILDYLPNLRPPEEKDTTEDETRIDTEITDVSAQISTLQQTFNYEDLVFKQGATDFFDHDIITGQFDDESLPANVTIIIPPIFTFQTQVFNISTAGFADFFDYTRAFSAVLYYVLLCGFIWFVFKGFILSCTKFARVLGFVLQW